MAEVRLMIKHTLEYAKEAVRVCVYACVLCLYVSHKTFLFFFFAYTLDRHVSCFTTLEISPAAVGRFNFHFFEITSLPVWRQCQFLIRLFSLCLLQNSQKKRGARPNNKPDKKLVSQVCCSKTGLRFKYPLTS